ncbi:hypothetical protein VKT23_009988 [Stygiomarasmius scandens]|uniref:Uncharacterized protein n=1 Tax=Marasmiellus scandens TaxID=2682957 RepID=A0ABR1JHG5_9AGAR
MSLAETHLLRLMWRDMSPWELFTFLGVNWFTRRAVIAYIQQAFSPQDIITRYFSDLDGGALFREVMRTSHAVISGSAALQVFHRVRYPESDLDVYVPSATSKLMVWYLEHHGYTFVPRSNQHATAEITLLRATNRETEEVAGYGGYDLPAIDDVLTFDKDGLKVELVLCRFNVIDAICSFHSTPVMNVITSDYAYCLYPHATLRTRIGVVLKDSLHTHPAIEKYRFRGWTMISVPPSAVAFSTDNEMGLVTRYPADRYCWVIPLSATHRYWSSSAGKFGLFAECDFDSEFIVPNSWSLRLTYEGTTTSYIPHQLTVGSHTSVFCVCPRITAFMKYETDIVYRKPEQACAKYRALPSLFDRTATQFASSAMASTPRADILSVIIGEILPYYALDRCIPKVTTYNRRDRGSWKVVVFRFKRSHQIPPSPNDIFSEELSMLLQTERVIVRLVKASSRRRCVAM